MSKTQSCQRQVHVKDTIMLKTRSCQRYRHVKDKVMSKTQLCQRQGHFKDTVMLKTRSSQRQCHVKDTIIIKTQSCNRHRKMVPNVQNACRRECVEEQRKKKLGSGHTARVKSISDLRVPICTNPSNINVSIYKQR
jgi:hypothetical protein